MIRQLGAEDLNKYRALWLEGLAREPSAFLLTRTEARAVPDSALLEGLRAGCHWGAFDGDTLIGLATWRRSKPERLRHTGDFGPFYIQTDMRGRGIGHHLLQAVLEAACKAGLLQIELCVDADNTAAIRLYRGAGFVEIGRRPRSVIIDGIARDDILMLCRLDGPGTDRKQRPQEIGAS